jgi:hypothetical protein
MLADRQWASGQQRLIVNQILMYSEGRTNETGPDIPIQNVVNAPFTLLLKGSFTAGADRVWIVAPVHLPFGFSLHNGRRGAVHAAHGDSHVDAGCPFFWYPRFLQAAGSGDRSAD